MDPRFFVNIGRTPNVGALHLCVSSLLGTWGLTKGSTWAWIAIGSDSWRMLSCPRKKLLLYHQMSCQCLRLRSLVWAMHNVVNPFLFTIPKSSSYFCGFCNTIPKSCQVNITLVSIGFPHPGWILGPSPSLPDLGFSQPTYFFHHISAVFYLGPRNKSSSNPQWQCTNTQHICPIQWIQNIGPAQGDEHPMNLRDIGMLAPNQ